MKPQLKIILALQIISIFACAPRLRRANGRSLNISSNPDAKLYKHLGRELKLPEEIVKKAAEVKIEKIELEENKGSQINLDNKYLDFFPRKSFLLLVMLLRSKYQVKAVKQRVATSK